MASGLRLGGTSANENEFIAEETLITVTSGVDHQPFVFISGTYGPLRAGFPCDLPLWLALTLRRKNKCTIQVPEWLSVEYLTEVISREKLNEDFEPLPFHYIEISHLLLNGAKEDIPKADEIAVLLQDVENIRMDRIRVGLVKLAQKSREGDQIHAVNMPNVSAGELASSKKLMIDSLGLFWQLIDTSEAKAFQRGTTGTGNKLGNSIRALQQQQQQSIQEPASVRTNQSSSAALAFSAEYNDAAVESAVPAEESGARSLRRFRT